MNVFDTIALTSAYLSSAREQGKSIGFVPTMGALHEGHLQLMRKAAQENDLLVVSIFVNPIQFNNPEDLKKYPRVLEKDLQLLEQVGCHVAFTPTEAEMYPEPAREKYHFGALEKVMEGAFRPGHFNGVAVVVKRLFEITMPHRAYFGEKDFQQLAIIQALVAQQQLPLTVIPCPTVRERDGLAMSSRNMRLTEEERKTAPQIYKVLKAVAEKGTSLTPEALQAWGLAQLQSEPAFEVEYFELADDQQLQPLEGWPEDKGVRAFVALQLGKVRLIDNIRII